MALSGDLSITVVYRADSATGPAYWRNTYEATAPAGGVGVTPSLVGAAFRDALLPFLLPNFWMDHIVISSYAPDGQPYNPTTFAVIPVARRGTANGGSTSDGVLPLTNVLHVWKVTDTGKFGHLFLRGWLTETQIVSDANGGVSLNTPASYQTAMDTLFAALQAGLGSAATLSLISGNPASDRREVTSFFVRGVTSKPLRVQRKTRVVQNSLQSMVNALQDGIVTIEEVPAFIEAAAAAARALGVTLPPLLP